MEKITQELARVETAIARMVGELASQYQDYLQILAGVLRQQLISAAYQVCTEIAPEAFLQLSMGQRQSLQGQIRDLATRAGKGLCKLIDLGEGKSSEEMLRLPSQWGAAINKALQVAAYDLNGILAGVGVLTEQLPLGLLENAAKAEVINPNLNQPNILSIVVEEQEAEGHKPKSKKVAAVYLRLVELEVRYPELGVLAGNLRSQLNKLKHLEREYRHYQREHQVAEAVAAWRATWSDEQG